MAYDIKIMLKANSKYKPRTLYDFMLHYYDHVTLDNDVVLNDVVKYMSLIDFDTVLAYAPEVYEYDWYDFISSITTAPIPVPLINDELSHANSDVISDYILSNYSTYEILPKITGYFVGDYDYEDAKILKDIFSHFIANVFKKNAEKYKKLYDAMVIEFNPLWNVDGTETTIRTLERDGTETTAHSGTDTDTKTFENSDTLTFDTDDRTDYHNKVSLTIDTDDRNDYHSDNTIDYLTTDTTTYNSVTNTKNGEETRTVDVDKAAFNSNVKQPVETTTDNLQYENFRDVKTGSETLAKTGSDTNTKGGYDTFTHDSDETTDKTGYDTYEKNGTETTDHSGTITDENEYDSTNTLTLDTVDTERIEHVRQGNIGVISTVKLLMEYADLGDYIDFIKTVSYDIVSELCYLA